MTATGQDGPATDADPLLGVDAAAARAGVAASTWRAYVARGRAPEPDDPDKGEGVKEQRRRPRWRLSTVDAFNDSRPGQGRRTDLIKARKDWQTQIAAELAEPLPDPGMGLEDWLRANH